MKKILLFIVIIALSFGAKAQSWTPIFGKQRFASGLGVPVKDSTYFAGTADSALIYINPKDAGFYYKYKGYHKKIGTGSVNSVALSMPSAFTVTGSPITNSGSFIVTGAGYITQYIRGDGSLATLNTAAVPESGNLYYTDARAKAAISGTSPISVTSGVVSISQANSTTNGYLSSTDWNTFNGKQAAINGTGFVKASGTTISYDNTSYYPASNPNGYTSNTGTVTSVSLTAPAAFNVSGSPITTTGTLALTGAGNSTQYIDGSGSLQTFPTMLSSDNLIKLVRNQSGATMTAGTIVYIDGATGNKPTISKALATSDATSAQTYGAVQADIANNADGYIVVIGNINNINTSGLTEGAQLYLSSTTAGAYTTTKQYAPAHLVYVGVVLRAHPTQGIIGIKIQNGYELDELHNVAAQTPSNNDGLFYESSTSLWKNKSISTVLGYTPEQPLTFSAPLSRSTNTVSIPAATSIANGYLSSTDWATFNAKQSTITLTTTGSSGSSTLVGATLNVPTYTLAGLGGQTQLNGTGFVKASGTTISYDNSTYLKGSGTTDYMARWSSTTGTLTDSYIAQNGVTTEVQGQGLKSFNGIVVAGRYNSVANAPKIYSSDETTGVTHIELVNGGGEIRLGVEKSTGGQILPGSTGYATVLTAGLSAKNLEFGTNNTKRLTIDGSTGAATFTSSVTASSLVKSGGTSSQFLKADGSVDASTYLTTSSASSTYLPLSGGTLTGAATWNTAGIATDLQNTSYIRFSNSGGATRWGYIQHDGTNLAFANDISGGIFSFNKAATFSSSVTATNIALNGAANANTVLTLQESSTLSSALVMINRNSTQKWNISVDANAVDDKYLGFIDATNSAVRMVLGANGNVGIGTTSPTTLLTVQGGIQADANWGQQFISDNRAYNTSGLGGMISLGGTWASSSDQTYFATIQGFKENTTYANYSGGLAFSTRVHNVGIAERMRITSGGNVEIGGTGLAAKLGVKQPASGLAFNVTNTTDADINFSVTQVGAGTKYALITPSVNIPLVFSTTSGSNVGIGTTSPFSFGGDNKTLDIRGGGTGSIGALFVGNSDRTAVLGFYINPGATATVGTSSNHAMQLVTNDVERMRITSGGAVGINTTNPSNYMLYVAGSSAHGLRTTSSTTGFWASVHTHSSGTEADLAGSSYAAVFTGGNVGIGLTSPGQLLDVAGNIRSIGGAGSNALLTGANGTSYGFFNNGVGSLTLTNSGVANVGSFNMSTGIYTPTSDKNKKKDFEISNIGLNEVLQLKPTLYRMKTDYSNGQKELGFIAQEVKEIIPNAYVENGDFIGLNFNPIVAALVKSIQELNQKITNLEAQIKQ